MLMKALLHYFFRPRKVSHADTHPLPELDLPRYLGRWYELARFETPFEEGLEEVFTEYSMRTDGNVQITNYGTDTNRRRHEAAAIGYPNAGGQLMVSFVPVLRFLSSPYNVLYVDSAYRHALVSDHSGNCLWFLGRTPFCTPDSFDAMKAEAQRRGFDLQELHYTRQKAE